MDRITGNLYIGDKEEAKKRNRLELNDIVYVVTLCDQETPYTTVHHPIIDGSNDQAEFDHAVEIVREALNQEHKVLVHCASGMSRSVTVVATVFVATMEISLTEALDHVSERRPEANPHPDILENARTYLTR